MSGTLEQPGLHRRTLRLYGELLCRRETWAGQLALAAFAGASGSGFAAAASLAGAASLTVDSDAVAMKAHFRDGAFDFVVNHLDEALRALKNEVRKGRPIAIGLIAEPDAALQEGVDRGVAADAVLCRNAEPSVLEAGLADVRSAMLVAEDTQHGTPELQRWLADHRWQVTEVACADAQHMATRFPEGDEARRRWVKNLTTHQRSARGERLSLWLSQDEAEQLGKVAS